MVQHTDKLCVERFLHISLGLYRVAQIGRHADISKQQQRADQRAVARIAHAVGCIARGSRYDGGLQNLKRDIVQRSAGELIVARQDTACNAVCHPRRIG